MRSINGSPAKVESMVKTMCALHNFLRTVNDPQYLPGGYADYMAANGTIQEGFWRAGPMLNVNLAATQARHSTVEANTIRDKFVTYLSSPLGSVPWQIDHIRRRR